jgi:hypothetical protein
VANAISPNYVGKSFSPDEVSLLQQGEGLLLKNGTKVPFLLNPSLYLSAQKLQLSPQTLVLHLVLVNEDRTYSDFKALWVSLREPLARSIVGALPKGTQGQFRIYLLSKHNQAGWKHLVTVPLGHDGDDEAAKRRIVQHMKAVNPGPEDVGKGAIANAEQEVLAHLSKAPGIAEQDNRVAILREGKTNPAAEFLAVPPGLPARVIRLRGVDQLMSEEDEFERRLTFLMNKLLTP